MAGPETIDLSGATYQGPGAQKAVKEELDVQGGRLGNVQTSQNIQEGAATLPYKGPKAQADLTDAQLKILRDINTNARDELKTFEALEIVKTYDQGMRYFTTALSVPVGRAGDQDLVTLAAKVQDPTGAVMQGDIDRYNNLQTALQYIPQVFRDQLANGGKFSPQARRDIIAFMRNRVNTYRLPYEETRKGFEQRIGQFNEQLVPLGIKPIEVDKILPGDPLKLYQPKIAAYDKKIEADRIRAERGAGKPSADLLTGVPEGAQIAGEDITGWRLSPEAEAEVVTYARQPNATPEGYAKLLADKAVAEGHVLPSQREDYMQRTARDTVDFFKQSPEQRAGVQGVDYSQIDKAASENAGLFEGVAQAGRNLPESGAQLLEGLVALPKDALLSAIEGTRTGTIKTFTDLAMELGQGQFDGPTTTAFADAMKERYGSLDAIQRTGIKDPLGLLGDLSMLLTAGGTTAARAPGAFGRFGEKVATAGRVIDPLSGTIAAVTEGVPALYKAGKDRMPGAVQGLEDLPTEILGFPSGTGGAPIREAAGAGFERGVTGAPTPRSEAFTEAMREPELVGDDLVTKAREAVGNLRQQGSDTYTKLMTQFGKNPTPLDIQVVRDRMTKIKPRSYDTWSSRKGPRPAEHLAWEQMNNFVEDYAAKAAKDPNLLMPLEMDQFKQDIYDVGSKIGGAYDRDASRIAGNAYNAVRQELVRHDPIYAEAMRAYEKTAREVQQLETTFGLAVARGKQPNIESVTRKLQAAIGRNNATVSYGQRAGQAERLNELDPEGTIIPTLAGTSLSSWKPRGLNAAVTLGAGIPAAFANPLALLAAPAFMPRVVGEATYGAGRAAGTGKRAFDAVAGSKVGQGLGAAGTGLAELYQKYPQLFLAEAQAGSRLQETEQERLERLYADSVPSVPANVIPEGYVPEERTTFVAPATAAPVAEAARAPVDEETIFTVGNVQAKFDPVNNDFYDVNDPSRRVKELADFANLSLNMYRGGPVQAFKNGGQPKSKGYDYANAARTFGQGLTFGFGDEIEARLRTLAAKDPNAYRNEVNRIRMMQERYADANPMTAGGLEMAGMLGGSMLAPSLAGVRAVSNAGRVTRLGANAVDAIGQGALYSAGKAKPDPRVAGSSRMAAVRSEAPRSAADFAILSGVGSAGKRLANTRGGQAVIDFAARPVRYAARQIRR